MVCARIIVPFFLTPVHFLTQRADVTTLAHHISNFWFLFIRLGSSRDLPGSSYYPVTYRHLRRLRRALDRTISIPFLGEIALQASIVRVSGRPLGTIVGIIRSNLRHLSH